MAGKKRKLTVGEKIRARELMEGYTWLARDVARKRDYRLEYDIALSVANEALCKVANDYVRLGYQLSAHEERMYFGRSLINALKKHTRKQERERRMVQKKIGHIVSLEKIGESEHPFVEMEAGEVPPLPLESFREFARTLPAHERAVFETVIQVAENEQDCTFEEIARSLGISERHLLRLRCFIREKLGDWIEYGYAA